MATEDDDADAADADAEVALEDGAVVVEVAEPEAGTDEEDPEPELLLASVAFKVPHFSLLLHVAWP